MQVTKALDDEISKKVRFFFKIRGEDRVAANAAVHAWLRLGSITISKESESQDFSLVLHLLWGLPPVVPPGWQPWGHFSLGLASALSSF